MSAAEWKPTSDPPSTSRQVLVIFDGDVHIGRYWRAHGRWDPSGAYGMAPTEWCEIPDHPSILKPEDSWRDDPPTAKQLKWLPGFRGTKGEASDAISRIQQDRKHQRGEIYDFGGLGIEDLLGHFPGDS